MPRGCTCAKDGTGGLCERCRGILEMSKGGRPGHPMVPPLPPMSEKSFQAVVIALAKRCGFELIYHTFSSKRSPAGWPDLALCKPGIPGRFLVAELKRDGETPTIPQQAWLDALATVPGVEVFCWHPADLTRITEILRG